MNFSEPKSSRTSVACSRRDGHKAPVPRRWLQPLLILLAVGAAGTWLWAQGQAFPGPQPAVGPLTVSLQNFVFSTPTTLVFTVRIGTRTLNPSTVILERLDADGHLSTTVSRMYDNGQGGDDQPGDRVFTATVTVTEPTVGRQYYRVAAAFRGDTHNAWSASEFVDVDPVPLPPDPGEAGKQTLEGIDSDGDGIRDDVQRWIAIAHIGSARTQEALRHSALASQRALTAASEADRRAVLADELAAVRCLTFLRGPTFAHQASVSLGDLLVNTPARSDADDLFAHGIKSSWFDAPRLTELSQFCRFDPDALPN